jgi:2-C-methyl-D-erythritol 4-phosphate cytidylyltransferase
VSGSASAILLAAGQGRRLGHDKSITAIAGRPVLAYGLEVLLGIRDIEKVVVAVRADVREEAKVWIEKNYPNDVRRVGVIVGGKERQDSVWEGLEALGGGAEWAVVQDAARVLTTAGLIERVMAGAKKSGAAAAARKMSDTVREADGQGNVVRLLDREGLWRMETPQVVRGTILRQGLQKARAEGKTVTDCMAAAELAGVKGILVEATEPNLKITLPSDWQLAEVWLKAGSK